MMCGIKSTWRSECMVCSLCSLSARLTQLGRSNLSTPGYFVKQIVGRENKKHRIRGIEQDARMYRTRQKEKNNIILRESMKLQEPGVAERISLPINPIRACSPAI